MGFINRLKNRLNSDGGSKELEKPLGSRNFGYLENLIENSSGNIVLDSDIKLDDDEASRYREGIVISRDAVIIDGAGHSIDACGSTQIFRITGQNVVLKNITLKNGYSFVHEGAAIINEGKTSVSDSKFINNVCESLNGGAISNKAGGVLELSGCEFTGNRAYEYGAIDNWCEIKISDCKFMANESFLSGAVIGSEGRLDISKSTFEGNISKKHGGAIINWGDVNITDCDFVKNSANMGGGAIFNQQGNLRIFHSKFDANSAKDGGAIFNYDNLSMKKSEFTGNSSKSNGGAVINYTVGRAEIGQCEFSKNACGDNGSAINNQNVLRIDECIFSDNGGDAVFNRSDLKIFNSKFKTNNGNSVITNDEGATISVMGVKFIENISQYAVYNAGESFTLSHALFDANSSYDIVNTTCMLLDEVTLKNPKRDCTILNESFLELKKRDESVIESICSTGEIRILVDDTKKSRGFGHLNELIQNSITGKIALNEDILFSDDEIYFYEGGIGVERDNIEIDGKNHIIDANSRSRIFSITGKNVVLKNITFLNARNITDFDNHCLGGGAIRIAKDGSVKVMDCKFSGNSSDGDGGAIMNNGHLEVSNTLFEDNVSKFNGGAIFNNAGLKVTQTAFKSNLSGLGRSIFNNGTLEIEGIKTDEPIFNNASLTSSQFDENMIDNVGFINRDDVVVKGFSFLKQEMEMSGEISLQCDIRFDFKDDYDLKDGIIIEEDLTVNGNGHIIDAAGSSKFFRIEKGHAVFRDLIFMNAYSGESPVIENSSHVKFERCRFINNRCKTLIENRNDLSLTDSVCSSNYSKRNSLIVNEANLKIMGSSFLNCSTDMDASVLANYKHVAITKSCFKSNYALKNAGVIINHRQGFIDIKNTEFEANFSRAHAGAMMNHGEIEILSSRFSHNSSKRDAGAIYNVFNINVSGSDLGDFIQNLWIVDAEFISNTSQNGGAILNEGVMNLEDSDFNSNESEFGGAIYERSNGAAYIGFTSFSNNISKTGGAIYLNEQNIRFRNCSFEGNVPDDMNI